MIGGQQLIPQISTKQTNTLWTHHFNFQGYSQCCWKNILILVEKKKSDSEFLSYKLMLNSGKKFALCATKKNNSNSCVVRKNISEREKKRPQICVFSLLIWEINTLKHNSILGLRMRIMLFNATFNNISAISWWSVLLMEEIKVPKKITNLL